MIYTSERRPEDSEPIWEFVSGPLNAGSFGPGDLENTFGPQLMFVKSPEGGLFGEG